MDTKCDSSNVVQIGTSTSVFYSWIDVSLIYSFTGNTLFKQIITYTPSLTYTTSSPYAISTSYGYPSINYISFKYLIPFSISELVLSVVMNKFIVQDIYTYISSVCNII